jgi:hypothetical protein
MKTQTFGVSIGHKYTEIRISPRHLEGELADSCRDAFTDEVNVEKLALARAIRKLFGARAFWWPDGGFGHRYGQVMRSLTPGLCTSITSRIRAAVDRIS